MKQIYVGLYASSPCAKQWNRELEAAYFSAIKNTLPPIAGLELPYFGGSVHPHDDEFFFSNIAPEWNFVLTTIPGVMQALERNPHFGLASDDAEGRSEAIAFYKKTLAAITQINQKLGREAVPFVEIFSAPTLPKAGVASSVASLTKSLQEICAWDWEGSQLVLEHCDANIGLFSPIKGFLPIEQEIAAIQSVGPTKTRLGIAINWGRSAIEERSPEAPLKHLRLAKAAGLLRGLIFSGATDKENLYGPWRDTHMPIAKEPGLEYFEADSLLTANEVARSLEAAGELEYLATKILTMPMQEATLERRVGLNRDTLRVVAEAFNKN